MTTDTVVPEDAGTGASDGDPLDAANFAAMLRATGWSNCAPFGLSFTADFGVPDLDITAGMAVIEVNTLTGEQSGEDRDQGNSIIAQVEARSGVSLTDSATNDIYLVVDLGADDNITIDARTSGTPSGESLKIGEVDTSADTTTELNRSVPLPSNLSLNGQAIEADDTSETDLMQFSNSALELLTAVRFASSSGVNDETLSGSKTISVGDAIFQRLDPGGSGRTITLPAESDNEGLFYRFLNTADAAEALTVNDDGGSTVATLNQNQAAWFACDGSSWTHQGIESISLS